MKCIAVKWLMELYEHFCANPMHAVNRIITSSIVQTFHAGKPVLTSTAIQQTEERSDTEDHNGSEESDTN